MKKFMMIMAALVMAASFTGTAEVAAAETVAAVPAAKTQTAKFSVSMHCKNCVKKITENMSFEKGVKDLKVDLASKTVTVTFDPKKTTVEKLHAALVKLGYETKTLAD